MDWGKHNPATWGEKYDCHRSGNYNSTAEGHGIEISLPLVREFWSGEKYKTNGIVGGWKYKPIVSNLPGMGPHIMELRRDH